MPTVLAPVIWVLKFETLSYTVIKKPHLINQKANLVNKHFNIEEAS